MAKLLSVSIPDDLMRDAEEIARARGKTKSELVRDALRRQIELERFRELQQYARRRAEELGIGPEDGEQIVDDLRAGGRS
jgi:metal-responsive CopG/Arc/MetJ family transcriptional regulator